jgi:hypothetical protein
MRSETQYPGPHLFTIEQRMLVMHAHEPRPPISPCDFVHVRQFPARHAARADVSHFTALYQVVQRPHGLFDGSLGIKLVNLKQVDVCGVESLERGINGIEYRRTRESGLVDVVPPCMEIWHSVRLHPHVSAYDTIAFGGNDDEVTWDIELKGKESRSDPGGITHARLTSARNLPMIRSDSPFE